MSLDEDKKKLYTLQQIPPLGEPLSIQRMTLRSIPYLCLGLAECLILANQVLRR